MTTKHEVYNTHRANPMWGSGDIAKHLGCCDAYVRATARRNGWALPKRVRATPEEAAARRAGPQLLSALTESRTTLLMLKRNVETEIRSHDGLFRWEGVPEAIQAQIAQCDAAIILATNGADQ